MILCGHGDDPRNRFWAERAGANAYVTKGRLGELARAIAKAVAARPADDAFFLQLSGGTAGVRDRIARHLDAALFDSVIAAEVRALASAGSFDRLFDLFAQFFAQVCRYRWVALATSAPRHFALHHHPGDTAAEPAARAALGLPETVDALLVADDDAMAEGAGEPLVRPVSFANVEIARLAVLPCGDGDDGVSTVGSLVSLAARELGGPIRMTALVEESQHAAATDLLTGLMNRRAFAAAAEIELSRSRRHGYQLGLALLDVDHFKLVNDRRGHAAGDLVLASLGAHLRRVLRVPDLAARWGGEEFVIAYTSTPRDGAQIAAERMRESIEQLVVKDARGERIPITVSIGLAELCAGDALDALVDRADRAMYASKTAGRNRLTVAASPASPEPVVARASRQAPAA